MTRTSRIAAFYKLSDREKIRRVSEFVGLNENESELLGKYTYLEGTPYLNKRCRERGENIIGVYSEVLRIAPNFRINGKDYIIPMVTEEETIVAGASNIARLCREDQGIRATYTESIMIGQVPIYDTKNIDKAVNNLLDAKNIDSLLKIAGEVSAHLKPRDICISLQADFLIAELFVDAKDAMGARRITEMCEVIRPKLEELTGGKSLMSIISNYDMGRLAEAELKIPKKSLGEETVDKILKAQRFAEINEKRAVTHIKGIMNGVISVAKATGNDDRAINAAVYSYTYRNGRCDPLSRYRADGDYLIGKLKIPMHIGTIGGATNHPMARLSLKIMGIKDVRELAEVMTAIGLVQNLAALRSLVTEGITEAHRRLEE